MKSFMRESYAETLRPMRTWDGRGARDREPGTGSPGPGVLGRSFYERALWENPMTHENLGREQSPGPGARDREPGTRSSRGSLGPSSPGLGARDRES